MQRAHDNYTAKHEEALRQLDQLEKTRGTYLQDELHAIHKLAAEYFAALANGYSINAPKSKSAQMMLRMHLMLAKIRHQKQHKMQGIKQTML